MHHPGRFAEFTESEARDLIGTSVETIAPFRNLPIRTRGEIVNASLEMPQSIRALRLWRVIVEWHVQDHPIPVRDWIAKWELDRYIQIVSG